VSQLSHQIKFKFVVLGLNTIHPLIRCPCLQVPASGIRERQGVVALGVLGEPGAMGHDGGGPDRVPLRAVLCAIGPGPGSFASPRYHMPGHTTRLVLYVAG
jgi:hypothetical protein